MLALHGRPFHERLFIQSGGPVDYQRQGDRGGVLLGHGDQEALTVGSDIVRITDRAGCAHDKQGSWDSGFELTSICFYVDGMHCSVTDSEEENFLAVAAPPRPVATGIRNLPVTRARWEWLDMDFTTVTHQV